MGVRTFRLGLACLIALVVTATSPSAVPVFSEWSSPVNLGATINSASVDSGPALSKDGRALYFHSNRPGGLGGNDIYVARRNSVDEPWGAPVNLGPAVNTSFEERAPNFSRDGHYVYFVSNRPGGAGGDDIWFSWRAHTRDDSGWSAAASVGSGINTAAGEASPGYLEDDDTGIPKLFFSSDRIGGAGAFDIYVSAFGANGSFEPAIAVPELNSPQGEQGPAPRFDGLEILFFSNRLGSINGSQDLWVATRGSALDPWSTPENLGVAVNTGSNEILPAISGDRQTLIFGSNRPGGLGMVDLYQSARMKLSDPND